MASEEEKKIIKKCKLKEDGWFEWCSAMEQSLNPEANSHLKGLNQLNLFNFRTADESCLGVCYNKSSKDRGIVLNKCPWCGEEILNKSKMKKESEVEE